MLRRCSNGFHLHSTFAYLNYSTSAVSFKDGIPNSLLVGLLVKSAGFSEEEAVSVARKVSNPFKCHENAEIVVDFLKQNGFDGTQIRKVIALRPTLLHCEVDKTLKPKFRVFQDFGFSGSNIGSLISLNPRILTWNVDSSIVPALGVLKSLLGSNEQVIGFMLQVKQLPWHFSCVSKNLPGNLLLLQRYGCSSERIKWLTLHSRFLFMSSQPAEELLKRVETKLGIPRTASTFVYGIYLCSKTSEEKINVKLELLRGYGWSETDILTLLKKYPVVLCLAENHLRAKLKYFMEDLGLDSHYLVMHSVVLAYSMEKKILPRVAVRQILIDEHLLQSPISLCSCLKMVESKFAQKYVMPYKEKLPQLYQNYTRAVSSSLSKP